MNVICEIINRTLSIKKELGLSYIFLEVDQATYAKVPDVMFKLEIENNKIFDLINCSYEWFSSSGKQAVLGQLYTIQY